MGGHKKRLPLVLVGPEASQKIECPCQGGSAQRDERRITMETWEKYKNCFFRFSMSSRYGKNVTSLSIQSCNRPWQRTETWPKNSKSLLQEIKVQLEPSIQILFPEVHTSTCISFQIEKLQPGTQFWQSCTKWSYFLSLRLHLNTLCELMLLCCSSKFHIALKWAL